MTILDSLKHLKEKRVKARQEFDALAAESRIIDKQCNRADKKCRMLERVAKTLSVEDIYKQADRTSANSEASYRAYINLLQCQNAARKAHKEALQASVAILASIKSQRDAVVDIDKQLCMAVSAIAAVCKKC